MPDFYLFDMGSVLLHPGGYRAALIAALLMDGGARPDFHALAKRVSAAAWRNEYPAEAAYRTFMDESAHADVACPAQLKSPHALRDCAFDARPQSILGAEPRCVLFMAHLLEARMLGLWQEGYCPCPTFCPGVPGLVSTRPTHRRRKSHLDDRLAR